MNRGLYVIIITLAVIFLIVVTLAVAYQSAANQARIHPNMWCYNDWKCKVPPAVASGSTTALAKFQTRHGSDIANGATGLCNGSNCNPGEEYDAKTFLLDPHRDCALTPDDATLIYVNPVTGCECAISERPTCVQVYKGCASLTVVDRTTGALSRVRTYECGPQHPGSGAATAYELLDSIAYGQNWQGS